MVYQQSVYLIDLKYLIFFKDINLSDKAVEIDKISAIPNIINEIMSNYEQYESIVNKVKLALISNKEEYESIATNFIKK